MAVLVAGPKKLRLIISNGKDKTFQTDFDAEGFAPNVPRQFKRVNAIDQVRNEGKPAQADASRSNGRGMAATPFFCAARARTPNKFRSTKRVLQICAARIRINIVVTTTDDNKRRGKNRHFRRAEKLTENGNETTDFHR